MHACPCLQPCIFELPPVSSCMSGRSLQLCLAVTAAASRVSQGQHPPSRSRGLDSTNQHIQYHNHPPSVPPCIPLTYLISIEPPPCNHGRVRLPVPVRPLGSWSPSGPCSTRPRQRHQHHGQHRRQWQWCRRRAIVVIDIDVRCGRARADPRAGRCWPGGSGWRDRPRRRRGLVEHWKEGQQQGLQPRPGRRGPVPVPGRTFRPSWQGQSRRRRMGWGRQV